MLCCQIHGAGTGILAHILVAVGITSSSSDDTMLLLVLCLSCPSWVSSHGAFKAEIIFFLPPCNAFWKDVRSDSEVEQEGKYSRDAAMSLQTDTPDARR